MSRDHCLAVAFAICSSHLNRRKGFQQYVIYGKAFYHKKLYILEKKFSVPAFDVLVSYLTSNQGIRQFFTSQRVKYIDLTKNIMTTQKKDHLA